MIQIVADIVMIAGGSLIFFQNFQYWRKHNDKDSIYWVAAGAAAVFLGFWVLVTRFGLPLIFTLDSNVEEVLGLSRRILYAVVALYFVGIGFWEYVWKR